VSKKSSEGNTGAGFSVNIGDSNIDCSFFGANFSDDKFIL